MYLIRPEMLRQDCLSILNLCIYVYDKVLLHVLTHFYWPKRIFESLWAESEHTNYFGVFDWFLILFVWTSVYASDFLEIISEYGLNMLHILIFKVWAFLISHTKVFIVNFVCFLAKALQRYRITSRCSKITSMHLHIRGCW